MKAGLTQQQRPKCGFAHYHVAQVAQVVRHGAVLTASCHSLSMQCACVLMDLVDPNAYLTLLPAAMKEVEKEFNKAAIVQLYDTIDFIGISSYAGGQCSAFNVAGDYGGMLCKVCKDGQHCELHHADALHTCLLCSSQGAVPAARP